MTNVSFEFVAGTTKAGKDKTGLVYATTGQYGNCVAVVTNKSSDRCRPKFFDVEAFIGIADAMGVTRSGQGRKFLDRLTKLCDEGYTFEGQGVPVKPEAPKVEPKAAKAAPKDNPFAGLDSDKLAKLLALVESL